MAQKRMFDKAIIETDKFLNISLTAKAMYFLLGMEADDEGFVSANRILRLYGGEMGDIKNLVDSGLIIPFKSGVIVITDWKKNNWLDSRRIKPTEYQLEKKLLALNKDNSYMLSIGLASAKREESSIEESSIEESSIVSAVPALKIPFSFKEEIQNLEESPRRDLNIIALFFEEKKPDILSKEQLSIAIKRHLSAASQLKVFTDNQIINAIPKARKATSEWTLETIIKVLTK